MGKLYSIGEVLIDFIPAQKGVPLKDVQSFERAPGGAPANVAAAAAKYGQQAAMITKLGEDAFGDFLIGQLDAAGVDTSLIRRTKEANTGLAFVSLREDGEREFSFYRKPSADLLLTEEEIDPSWFKSGDILHFCSVDLVESPMKSAHKKAVLSMAEAGGIVSFDPNIRLPLWDNPEECREAVREFLPLADLLKISDEELEFITGMSNVEEAVASLFTGRVKAVVFTKGADGADLYVDGSVCRSQGFKVQPVDTTGAGDAFIGGFLARLLELGGTPDNLVHLFEAHHGEILAFANASGALTTTGKGAISALPGREQITSFLREHDM